MELKEISVSNFLTNSIFDVLVNGAIESALIDLTKFEEQRSQKTIKFLKLLFGHPR